MADVCQEARRPASYIWLPRSLQRVLGLDLTFRKDWRQKWMGQWVFARGGVSAPGGWCSSGMLCSIYLYQMKQEASIINNQLTPIVVWIIFFAVRAALYFVTSHLWVILIWHRIIAAQFPPPLRSALKIRRESFVLPSMAAAVIRVSPGATKLSLLGCTFLQSWHHRSYFCSLFFPLALCLRYPCWHPLKRFHPSSKQPDNVAALQGEKSEVLSQHTTGSGNGFECRSRVARMWGIVSLCIQEIVEEQQPRGGVLAPVAAEAESLVSFNLVFSVHHPSLPQNPREDCFHLFW